MSVVLHRTGQVASGSRTESASHLSYVGSSKAAPTTSAAEQGRIGVPFTALLDAVEDAERLASEDAEQAPPKEGAFSEAYRLLKMLPAGILPPQPVVEPSGAIAWVWDEPERGFLVLAVNGCGQMEHSAAIEGTESSGRSPLVGQFNPALIALLETFTF